MAGGSYKAKHGTFTFVSKEADSTDQIVGDHLAQGHQENQSSLSSEFSGCYGAVVVLQAFCDQHGTEEVEMDI